MPGRSPHQYVSSNISERIVSYRIGAFAATTRIVSDLLIRIEYSTARIRSYLTLAWKCSPLSVASPPAECLQFVAELSGQSIQPLIRYQALGGRRGGTQAERWRCETQVPPPPCGCFEMVALHCVQSGRTVSFHFMLHGLVCALSTRRFDRIPVQTALLRPCGTCCEASVGSPSRPVGPRTGKFNLPVLDLSGREGDPTLASQHVPQVY